MAKISSTDYEANLVNQINNTMKLLANTMEMYQENIEALIMDYQQARRKRELEEAEALERQVSLPDISPR